MNSRTAVIAALPIILSLSACNTAEKTGTFAETRELNGGRVLLNTPELRAVFQTEVGRDSRHGRVTPRVISCVEPSADVAKVVGSSFNVGAALSAKLPNGIDPNIALAIANSTAGAVAQLGERMATIQLLRDGLFRACEAYANGALSDISYAVLLSRYDDTMVTLLANELAAGNFGRSLAAASSEAGGSSRSSLEVAEKRDQTREAERQLDTKRVERRDAEQKLDEKKSEAREAERQLNQKRAELRDIDGELTKSKIAEGDLQRAAAGGGPNAAQRKSELAQKQKESTKLEAERSDAQKTVSKLESETNRLQKESQQLEATVNQKEREVTRSLEELNRKMSAEAQSSAKTTTTAAGGITRLQDKDVAQVVADIQRKYLENINTDSLVVACLVALDRPYTHTQTLLQNKCPDLLSKIIDNQSDRVRAIIDEHKKKADSFAEHRDVGAAAETLKKAADHLRDVKSRIP